MQISESIIRSQIVKLEQKKSSVKPRPVRAAAPVAPAAEAAAPEQEAPVAPVEE